MESFSLLHTQTYLNDYRDQDYKAMTRSPFLCNTKPAVFYCACPNTHETLSVCRLRMCENIGSKMTNSSKDYLHFLQLKLQTCIHVLSFFLLMVVIIKRVRKKMFVSNTGTHFRPY